MDQSLLMETPLGPGEAALSCLPPLEKQEPGFMEFLCIFNLAW